jgi:glycosyltransferase involved in cell wall biosynthesis
VALGALSEGKLEEISHALGAPLPTASVVIPTYNHARYVAGAIDSALHQTYEHVEIIVVDDGSTDDTRAVVAPFGNRVQYVWQQNRGLSAARNAGLRIATGKYVAFFDADDLWDPDFLGTLVGILEAQPDAGAAHSGHRFIDAASVLLPQVEDCVIPAASFHQALLQGNFMAACSVLVRRSCLDAVGDFDESLQACEDWDVWLRLARHHRFIGTPKVLAYMRALPGSMSSDPRRMLESRLLVLEKHIGPESEADHSEANKRAYGRTYLSGCLAYVQSGNAAQAYECLVKMAETSPDLLAELDSFYALACGGQPRGFRGHFASLDLVQSTAWLMETLARLFADPRLRDRISAHCRLAYGNAYLALGMLSYGARRMGEARGYLLRAATANPALALDRRLILPFLKSILLQAGWKPAVTTSAR